MRKIKSLIIINKQEEKIEQKKFILLRNLYAIELFSSKSIKR